MNEQNAEYSYSEILLNLKKEWYTDTCYNMDDT